MKKTTYGLWHGIYVLLFLVSGNVFSQTVIDSENFETGGFPFTYWNDGGADCSLDTASRLSGTNSTNLQANNGSASSMYTTNINLTTYGSVTIGFDFVTSSFGWNHKFYIEFSNDGGTTWHTTPIATYTRNGSGFSNGTTYTGESVTVVNTTYGGTHTFTANSRFRFRADAPTETWRDLYIDNVTITGYAPAPEIDIQGNSTSIANGDLTPSASDHTDYTTANAGLQITRTFTIQNTGTANLTISSIVLSNTTDFTIIAPFHATPVAFGGSTTFTVRYNALTLGTKTSTVTITNNDSDEFTYQFGIEARSEQNFFDSDGDGVYDNIDIDDDNDGIVDSDEELACQVSGISTTVNYKFLNETFGEGTSRATINTTYDAITTYCYEDGAGSGCFGGIDLNDGEYTVYYKAADGDGTNDTPIGEVASWADTYWYTGEDHTPGDTDGRMAMFNASYDPGVFYTASITGSLPNVPITYSFWVLNLDTTLAPGIATRLRPDILVEFRDVNNNVLASITTGDIPPSINGDPANSWHEFTADLTLNVTEFYVYFINNETGGQGNDLAIDDIVISQTLCDTDSDGVADLFDLDSDNDGIPDVVEAGLGNHSEGEATLTSIAAWVDVNGNGMHDLIEGNIVLDSDDDGVPNYLDLDSDNDTIFDVDESGAGNTADPLYQNGDGDINGDGVGDGLDTDAFRETDVDSDGTLEYYTDGILDIYDYFNGGTYATGYGNINQGLGSIYYVLDSDLDGLPDYMDTTSDGSTYDISHTLYASLDANNDGVIDDTNDAEGDGIVDLFDTNDAIFGSPRDLNRKLELYFDGRNDYIEDTTVMGTWGEATQMGWIKIDPATSGSKVIMGQDNFYITLNADLSISTTAKGVTVNNGSPLATNRWIHVGATYSTSSSLLKLYINGQEVANDAISGNLASDTSSFTIGREPDTDSGYFMGYIDEAKIFAKALTDDEYQKNVYQEIEDNTLVRGAVIPRDIATLDWSDVSRYFMFDIYKDDITDDLTTAPIDTGTGAKMHNFKVIDYQTAPLPFITQSSGVLSTAVDIPSDGVRGLDATTYDWSIVRVEHDDVTYNANQKHLGLIINELDAGTNPIEYHVQNDSELNVSWYLKLDGFIDLEGESQLVQGDDSMLDVTSKGYIERDQQGTADLYTYNYWAAPVGATSIVSNNNNYTLPNILRDGTTAAAPVAINWIASGYDGTSGSPVGIADYWIWKYANQISDDYPSWQHVRSTGSLQPGEGYTMKGTTNTGGAISTEQNYVFNGKPHNGNITLTLSAGNDYLIGNPYASAIDANEFILDNVSDGVGRAASNIIDGSLYFWEHFASSTHILREYQGGYGVYNLMGSTAAILSDTRINHTGGLVSSKGAPQQYIPVGQGFFVTADTGGTITFKNSQRTFKTEASDPSTFMRAAGSKKEKINNSASRSATIDTRQKLRLMFDSPKGYHRELLLGADQNASPLFDRGYDAPLIEDNVEDVFWTLDGGKYVIQGVENFIDSNVFPLGIKIDEEGEITIKIQELENITSSFDIFLRDKDSTTFHDLNLMPYKINLPVGEYLDRFEIVFHNKSLSIDDDKSTALNILYSNAQNNIIIINPENNLIKTMAITNLLGQEVFFAEDIGSESYSTIKPRKLSTGAYIIKAATDKGVVIKKVIIE
ncbi:choice-of-anchor D domain-containing protein [Flavobacteriaceae bacterium S0825]|uniref:LamG-like jellyroll fold domain-containing protein n=1 Tax=Gaetbulibacter sp. S0825 TaxID=2720084 RepID=UPI00142F653E|nr:LamG-like jellyroll fold domain-containing protein [Gaetbulibacter sp. S0825]MCK0109376.1 choice-of-anchor D domain-containing protein [Flavobacteriaceae bacterium S0825]NIX65010.1 choice-of-anchor D domain-containing protein [Gaetbulibacter sp. S0825]